MMILVRMMMRKKKKNAVNTKLWYNKQMSGTEMRKVHSVNNPPKKHNFI